MTKIFASRHTHISTILTLLLVGGVVSGCSTDASESPDGTAGSSDDILIGTMAPIGTPQADLGGIPAALEAAAADVNKNGGINGRNVRIVTCNTQYGSNQELACARQLVKDGVVAVAGMNNVFQGAAVEKIFADADIADIANTGPLVEAYQGTNTFPLTWETGSFIPCASSPIAEATGGKVVQLVAFQDPASEQFAKLMQRSAEASGLKWNDPIFNPPTVSDFSPYVARAQASGADIVVIMQLGSGPQAFVKAASAVEADFAICTALGLSGAGGWDGLGSAEENLYVGATFRPLSESTTVPMLERLVNSYADLQASSSDYAAYSSTNPADMQAQGVAAWLGVQALAQVARTIEGDVTPTSVIGALPTAKVSMGGIIPDIDFTKLTSAGEYERVFNSDAYLWKWDASNNDYTLAGEVADTLELTSGR
ncbi:amino acid/amide ABC transporter substrate-binding protein (HAAT family) [Arthrobacter sp. SLBN-100]|uniref:ABC transporter substrate-binding protein n=1 Tax=Arthrobacter sp. SLBN-100 TaxID=2768450 RepID=UPI00114DAE55|nr:ABC transporter substrate-binding protein [Arthrobacter sp. SLBN-100]TQJ62170.1 amino acid/amide ABC transporter substrate-binding protein (HAAT family) [Arthrobacter sp. SLBN-100]